MPWLTACWAVIVLVVIFLSWLDYIDIKGDWYLAFAGVFLILLSLESIRGELEALNNKLYWNNITIDRSLNTIEQTLDRIKTLLENRTGGF